MHDKCSEELPEIFQVIYINQSYLSIIKLINRYYKILRQKSTSIFEEQTRIPLKLNIEKIWCRQKRKTIEQFLQISVHTDMKSTEEAFFEQKNPKIDPFVAKSLLESNWKRFHQSAIRENFNLKHKTQLKKNSFQ